MKTTLAWTLVVLLAGAGAHAGAAEPVAAAPEEPAPAAIHLPAPRVSPEELASRIERQDPDLVVLDVRSPEEFAAGHVPGARNVSHEDLPARIEELAASKDKDVVLYCRSGRRSQLAAQSLRDAGFTRLLQLEGDYPAWEARFESK